MNVVILCGGRGMRLNGGLTPKALAEVKGKTIVRCVMDIYKTYTCGNGFHLLLGSLADAIRLHFLVHTDKNCSLYDTGIETMTGGRLKRWMDAWYKRFNKMTPTFCVSYCDCLANVDIGELLAFHRSHGKLATLTAVPAISGKGVLGLEGLGADPAYKGLPTFYRVRTYNEKPRTTDWINFGFFVFEPGVAEFLTDGMLEEDTLPRLAEAGELMAWKHRGWYISVDSPKELEAINAVEGTPWLIG